jgi:putative transposase
MGNVFIERLWRSVKYENIYLLAYESISAPRSGLKDYFVFYNSQRTHQSLANQTPDEVYFKDDGPRHEQVSVSAALATLWCSVPRAVFPRTFYLG